MKPNKFAPLYPPPRPDSPDNIPHYPEWPYAPHADWPHGYSRRWNDTEPAHVVPYPVDCCYPGESDCLCITSADMALWNSYSGLSGLTAFDPEALSAIYEKVQDMDDYSAIRDCYYTVSANSAIWNSAAYIPNIYDNLSALYDGLNEKADYSAISAYCDIGIHDDGTVGKGDLKIWSDSLKDYYYGDRVPHDMTIVGDGTLDRPLRVGKDIVMGAMAANSTISAGGLVSQDDLDKVKKSVEENMVRIRSNKSDINQCIEDIRLLANNLAGLPTTEFVKATPETIIALSESNPEKFYYC